MDYYKINNQEGKQWILQKDQIAIGLILYQPSSWKGKLLKTLLPLLVKFRFVKDILRIEECNRPIDDCILQYLHKFFSQKHLDFSFFMGTPSKNQKITMQISMGQTILGYCKITNEDSIYHLFCKEEIELGRLKRLGLMNQPLCLECRQLINGSYIFLQSTTKTIHSTTIHKFGIHHLEFLKKMVSKTMIKLSYKDSDFGRMMTLLREHINCFPNTDKLILQYALEQINHYYNDKTSFCAYHADFTPWNTYIEKNELFAFDWEYAKQSCPPFMDIMHFVGQVGILEKHLEPKQLVNEYYILFDKIKDIVEDPEILYISYLLYIFTFYSNLYNWNWNNSDRCYFSWIQQLDIYKNNKS